VAGNGTYLAHDLIRAFGKHLPVPDGDHDQPAWTNHSERSWRIAAAWTLTLGITHLTVCRAHRISTSQWERLLALSARTGVHLTMLCNGPIPPEAARLLATITHQHLDNVPAAAAHWQLPPGLQQLTGYRWWQQSADFPPPEGELWFRMPPPPRLPATGRSATPPPAPAGPVPLLPQPGAHQDHPHPHITKIAGRIHSRIGHPVHAACVAIRALTGYSNEQIKDLYPGESLPPLPAWADLLMDAARRLAELRGHPDTPNPLFTPHWEHPEIDQALHACHLLPSPPARRQHRPGSPTPRSSTSVRATTSVLRARSAP
jgi:hypothetical protein